MGMHDHLADRLRVPPQSVEAEQAVLGGLMLAPDAYFQISDQLAEDDFYRRDHQLIYRAIRELADKNRPFDAVTLGEWFDSMGLSEQVAGGAYLIELASTTPSAANIVAYAEIVTDKARLRRLIDVGTGIVQSGFNTDGRTSAEVVADAQQAVAAIGENKAHRLKSVHDGLSEMVEAMQRRMDSGGMIGTSYGLPAMDEMTGGKQPGDLIIIAGRPSMGKTTLALQGAMAAGRPLIFSFETRADKLLSRLTAHVGQFPLRWILFPQEAPEFAFDRIVAASRVVKERLAASIYDGRRLTSKQLRALAIREHRKSPLKELVIDHFGHIVLGGRGRTDQEMGEASKDFKELARELEIPVVLLMQLNRGVEARVDKRPILSDLRECGAAEEDADVVAMIYRDGYYNPTSTIKSFGEIFLRKNRDGDPGEIWTRPVLPEMRFDEAEPQQRPNSTTAKSGESTGVKARGYPRGQPSPFPVVSGNSRHDRD